MVLESTELKERIKMEKPDMYVSILDFQCKVQLKLFHNHSHYSETRDLGLKTCQSVKTPAEASIDSTPISLVFTL